MSDSMQKILEEMRNGWRVERSELNEWADRIEALMKEPVAEVLDTDEDEAIVLMKTKLTVGQQLFSAPPDTQAMIDAAREELAAIFDADNGEWYSSEVSRVIRSKIGKPLEKKP